MEKEIRICQNNFINEWGICIDIMYMYFDKNSNFKLSGLGMFCLHLTALTQQQHMKYSTLKFFKACGSLFLLLFSRSVMFDSLRPHGLQHARLLCPSPSPGACSNSCPSSQWWHSIISSFVIPFSCLQSFPASRSFLMSQLFTSGGQSIGASASASILLRNVQDWFPLGLTGLISLQSKGLSRFFV